MALRYFVDRSLYGFERENFDKYLTQKACIGNHSEEQNIEPPEIIHIDSRQDRCIQVVDFVAGAINHRYFMDDSSYYNTIEQKISILMDFFEGKDKNRMDLKRFVLGMIVNQHGVPLFMQSFSGNKSDKKSLPEMIQKLRKSLSLDDSSYWVADSAIYSEENLKLLGNDFHWLTRVPETLGAVKDLISADLEMIPASDPRYAFHATSLNYGEIAQNAVVFWSQEMQIQKEKTFDKNFQKKRDDAKKDLNSLKRQRFACEPDAITAAKK